MAVKTTFKRVLRNQIPIENDHENDEYDDDHFDAYDDDNAMTGNLATHLPTTLTTLLHPKTISITSFNLKPQLPVWTQIYIHPRICRINNTAHHDLFIQ